MFAVMTIWLCTEASFAKSDANSRNPLIYVAFANLPHTDYYVSGNNFGTEAEVLKIARSIFARSLRKWETRFVVLCEVNVWTDLCRAVWSGKFKLRGKSLILPEEIAEVCENDRSVFIGSCSRNFLSVFGVIKECVDTSLARLGLVMLENPSKAHL